MSTKHILHATASRLRAWMLGQLPPSVVSRMEPGGEASDVLPLEERGIYFTTEAKNGCSKRRYRSASGSFTVL